MKLGLLVNPAAGNGRAQRIMPELLKRLRKMFKKEPLVQITRPAKGDAATDTLLSKGADVIVCLGGDGTFNQAAQRLANTGVPVALVPGGRGNDLIKSIFGKSLSWKKAVERLSRAEQVDMDIGLVQGPGINRFFVNGFGLGFDALVARKIDQLRPMTGLRVYLKAVFSVFKTYEPVFVDAKDGPLGFAGPCLMAGAGVGKFLGGGFKLFPKAHMRDGLLDFHFIEPLPKGTSDLVFAHKVLKVIRGKHLNMKQAHYAQGEAGVFRLRNRVSVQMDGEVLDFPSGDFEISCVSRGLRVLI